jgi:hypothetical protein
MFTLFEWGFRLAVLLPWIAVMVGIATLLMPRPQKSVTPASTQAAA